MTGTAALYADEDFSRLVVEELRRLGHDILTAQEAGQGNRFIPDPTVLASAIAQKRAVLTHNRRHFMHLHRQGIAHAGMIVRTRDDDVAALAARIHEALSAQPVLDNQLIRIVRPHRP